MFKLRFQSQSHDVRLLRTKVILKLDHGTNHSYEFTELGSSCIRCFLGATGAPAQQRHRKLRCRIDPGGLSVPFCSVTLSELSHGHMVKKYPANTAQSKLSTKQVARSFYQLWPQLLHKMQAVFHVFWNLQFVQDLAIWTAWHLLWQTSLFIYSKVARSSSVSNLLRNWRKAKLPQKDERWNLMKLECISNWPWIQLPSDFNDSNPKTMV